MDNSILEKIVATRKNSEELFCGPRIKKPVKLTHKIKKEINCYAYALGLLYPRDAGDFWYNPGFTQNLDIHYNNSSQIKRKIQMDLENLKIKYKFFSINSIDKIKIEKKQYLVVLYFCKPNIDLPNGEFHFIRQDPKTKIWFHKSGYEAKPCILGNKYHLECDFYARANGNLYKLNPVCCILINDF